MKKNYLISSELIFTSSKNNLLDVFKEIENCAFKNKIIKDNILADELIKREQEASTNMGNGVAIPHCRNDKILESKVIIVYLNEPIKYDDTENKVSYIFCLLVPTKEESSHLSLISKVAEFLLEEKFIKNLKEKNYNFLLKKINGIFDDKPELQGNSAPKTFKETKKNKDLKIVAVTSCIAGIAHTHMVAKTLENAAKKLNYQIKVEKQAAEGTINELSFEDIQNADVVIISATKFVDKKKFVGKKVYEVSMNEVLQDPVLQIQKSFEDGKIYRLTEDDKSDNVFVKRKQKTKTGIMGYLMNGVSYMLPIVIVGGLLIAISAPFLNTNKQWLIDNAYVLYQILNSLSTIGGLAFTIMIPVLAGFIAAAIADRIAIAPAMILAFIANYADPSSKNSTNTLLFDWSSLNFGLNRGQLGYLGAIFIGLAVGYVCLQLKKVHWPEFILPLIPIMIVPILVTTVGWILLAFIVSAPIFYLQEGINNSISYLQAHNLVFILGILLGFLIAIDMGGPLNKIAFFFGVQSITKDGAIMGMDASAISVPPLGAFFAWFLGRKYFDEEDAAAGKNALPLGIMGITEGAIPFAVKYPKFIISNVIGGMIAASLSGVFQISDAAGHGGVIVYILGAIGKVDSNSKPVSNYAWGAFHLAIILVASLITAGINIGFRHFEIKKTKSVVTVPFFTKIFKKSKMN
ncbi:PTS sugar transporter subunit IIA [symbiont of Argiope bruennichi]|uniref:PTS fructose transporter subunit IIABC n=1 Tax=symbiont of Argiope bruennichi TaxID=2810479 RepID=UPI003DA4B427